MSSDDARSDASEDDVQSDTRQYLVPGRYFNLDDRNAEDVFRAAFVAEYLGVNPLLTPEHVTPMVDRLMDLPASLLPQYLAPLNIPAGKVRYLTNLFNMVLFWALVLHGLLCLGLRWLLNGAAALQSVSNPGSLLYALLFVFAAPLFLNIFMFLDSLDLLWMIVWIPVRLAACPALPSQKGKTRRKA